ncbi:MAG: sporulation protein YqfD [Blautia sp.]|nr:sporulation protein YqfD [Blautia sp.]MDD5965381.1 sporulation protein YqfD [Blautia sp.]
MMANIQRQMKGYVRIRVHTVSYDRFLNICALHNLYIWDLKPVENAYEMNLSIEAFRRLKPLARKTGTHIRIIKKCGLPFWLFRNRHRKAFAAGFVGGASLLFLFSFFIWNIEVSGNRSASAEVIYRYLKEEKATYGTLKNTIDCKKLQADLREKFPDFLWVSAKIKGTSLLIDVKENDLQDLTPEELPESDLIAGTAGTIERIITRQGRPQVHVGDRVKKGDLLVSSEIPILNDEKEVTGYEYCAADADILIKTVYEYRDSFPLLYEEKLYTGREKSGFLIQLGSQLFSLKPQKESYQAYDLVTEERQFGFSRYFKLPLFYGRIYMREYRLIKKRYSSGEAIARMQEKIEKNMEKIREKGVQIFENDVKIETDEKSCSASGQLTLIQKTGKRVERTKTDS